MNRWKKAALISVFAAAAMCFGSPASAAMNVGYQAETAAINVANHFPGNMATGVAVDTPLTVEFAGPINQSFYQTINFSLFKGTQPIDGELFYNPAAKQVMFKAKQPLNPGEAYTAQISYFDGLGRNADRTWSFRTMGNNAYSAAAVPAAQNMNQNVQRNMGNPLVLTNASMGAGSIMPDMPLEISFSEPLDIASLKQAPVQLFEDNKQIPVDYKLSRDLKTITVTPRTALKPTSSYAVAVERTLASNKGSSLANRTLIPFKLAGSFNEPVVASHEINELPASSNNYANYTPQTGAVAQAQKNTVQLSTYRNQYQIPVQQQNVPQQQMQQPVEPAQIIGLSPQNGAKVTNLTQPVTVAFNCDIKPETLNEFTFRLEDDFGPVPAKIHYFEKNRQATLTPVGILENGRNYRVVVTQGITDIMGRPVKTGISSMFATASPSSPAMPNNMQVASRNMAAPNNPYQQQMQQQQNGFAQSNMNVRNETAELEAFDSQDSVQNRNYNSNINNPYASQNNYKQAMAPADKTVRTGYQQPGLTQFKVTSIYPASNADNVSRKSKIALNFSEQADPNTVDNINISVFANQKRVDGKVTYDKSKNRAIFEPSSQLDAKTDYKVIVSNKILSALGEPLATRVSWQFSTAENEKKVYKPVSSAEADAAFYIPLADSKYRPSAAAQARLAAANGQSKQNNDANQQNFGYVPPKHWSFKSMRHISNKGMLPNFPFTSTNNVTRYEFASAINSALTNLKTMEANKSSKLKVSDMVQLEQLIAEYRPELNSYGVNTAWFEGFLSQQGVNLQQVEAKVKKM